MTRREPAILLIATIVALIVSRVGALEPGTWVLEVFPIFLAIPVLVLTAKRFPLTPLAYRLLFVHALILMLGGHYTYAKVPLGFWVQDALHLGRESLRPPRPLRAGLRPRDHRARGPAAPLAPAARQVARSSSSSASVSR